MFVQKQTKLYCGLLTSLATAIIHVEEAKTLSLSFGIETNEHAVATGV